MFTVNPRVLSGVNHRILPATAIATLLLAGHLVILIGASGSEVTPAPPPPFVVSTDSSAPLLFGVRGGIHIALHPAALDGRPEGGPRGLIRVGLEIDGQMHLVNSIAIEPVVGERRGLSELERSADGQPGKRFTLKRPSDPKSGPAGERRIDGAAPWIIESTPQGKSLRFLIDCEPFSNGAHPIIEVALFENEPLAVRFRTLAAPDSAAMDALVLTATMGNQSRCRELWLADAVVSSRELYSDYRGTGFTERESYELDRLHRTHDGDLVIAITPDEVDPRESVPFANGAWRCTVPWMAQYWLKPRGEIDPKLRCRVNGRRVYWAGTAPIPCGPSFENFELIEPFRAGSESWFGFSRESPALAFGLRAPRPFPKSLTRTISVDERRAARAAQEAQIPLRNGDFAQGMDAWSAEGGARHFRVFESNGARRLTTFGSTGDGDQGRLYQCFTIPKVAQSLRFFVHGGADARVVSIRLWHKEKLWRWTSGRDDNEPFLVEWEVSPLCGEVVTLEIVDQSAEPWGFIGVHGIEVVGPRDAPRLTAP